MADVRLLLPQIFNADTGPHDGDPLRAGSASRWVAPLQTCSMQCAAHSRHRVISSTSGPDLAKQGDCLPLASAPAQTPGFTLKCMKCTTILQYAVRRDVATTHCGNAKHTGPATRAPASCTIRTYERRASGGRGRARLTSRAHTEPTATATGSSAWRRRSSWRQVARTLGRLGSRQRRALTQLRPPSALRHATWRHECGARRP